MAKRDSRRRTQRRNRFLSNQQWQALDTDGLSLEYRYADSVLQEFVWNHRPSDILRELVQNEYDAEGTQMTLNFGTESLTILGNGNPVDTTGWKRLSVVMGTGTVTGLSQDTVKPKVMDIGSKNFGLRTAFQYGDQIHIRSAGSQTVLDRSKGAPTEPLPEPNSRGRRGIQIRIPYRTIGKAKWKAFDADKEREHLDSFSEGMMLTLMKLVQPGSSRSLDTLEITSERHSRRIVWKQYVKELSPPRRGLRIVRRRIRMKDTDSSATSSWRKLEELEFQTTVPVPPEHREQDFPKYFRLPRRRVRIGLSLPTRGKKIDLSRAGLFFYPLGMTGGYTGNAVSVNGPFELNGERTNLTPPDRGTWNAWLIEEAAKFTIELVRSDWLERFGAEAYLALRKVTEPVSCEYLDMLNGRLKEEACWATRAHASRPKGSPQFEHAEHIVIPEASHSDDNFLSDDRYLDPRIASDQLVRDMAEECGAKSFTANSLVRLRCAGKNPSSLSTKLQTNEADFHYPAFPAPLPGRDLQERFARALATYSERGRLSQHNLEDLGNSPTTLAADDSLMAPVSPLWVVDPDIAGVCPIPEGQRLHPSLNGFKVLSRLCKPYHALQWASDVAMKAGKDEATAPERLALYRFILRNHAQLSRRKLRQLRRYPILHDHRGDWVEPQCITLPKTQYAASLEAVIHFPHDEYTKDTKLAKLFEFKQKVDSDDIVAYARLVEARPELSGKFEETLDRLMRRKLLKPKAIIELSKLRILPSSLGGHEAPDRLYLINPTNTACLGQESAFVTGSRHRLYEKLGCRTRPEAEDIIAHLAELQSQGVGPERPEVLYPELVRALERRRMAANSYAGHSIIWNGRQYSSPESTLLGDKYRGVFLGTVPQTHPTSATLETAFARLGVHRQPGEQHWRQLFAWFGQQYHQSGGPVTKREQQSLLSAYSLLSSQGLPGGMPSNLKCLLDQEDRLHSLAEVRSGRYVIDNDPDLAKAVVKQAKSISLAAGVTDMNTSRFHYALGVKPVTDVCRRLGGASGDECPSLPQGKIEKTLALIQDSGFASAVLALADHERRSRGEEGPVSRGTLLKRLRAWQRISVVRDIQVEYAVHTSRVLVPREFLVEQDRLVLKSVRSQSELHDLVANALAQLLVPRGRPHRGLVDGIYRLLGCPTNREKKHYLDGSGIRWDPRPAAKDKMVERPLESEDEEMVADELMESLLSQGTPGDGAEESEEGPDRSTGTEERPDSPPGGPQSQPDLPPIDDVSPTCTAPCGYAVPPRSPRGKRPRVSSPPRPRNSEWDMKVGHRGEEVVYREERERVKNSEWPEERVIWVAETDPLADYDILSVDDDGSDLWIEVKSTTERHGRFSWPSSEFRKALEKRDRYMLIRVYEAHSRTPSYKRFRDPIAILLDRRMRLDVDGLSAEIEPLGSSDEASNSS